MKAIGDDIDTVKYMMKQTKEGKPILDPVKKEMAITALKEAPKELITKSWYWILAILFVFCAGYLIGIQHGNVECNNFIIENYVQPELDKRLPVISPSVIVFPCQPGEEKCDNENYSVPKISDIPG